MENSMKPSYEQGQRGTFSLLVSISLGFSLLWLLFFLSILYDPFAQFSYATTGFLWHGPLPAATAAGFAIADVAIFKWCDWFSKERGHRALGFVAEFVGIFPAGLILIRIAGGVAIPAALAVAAWFVMGLGLGCLLSLWSELLICFVKRFASKILVISGMLGATLYLIVSCLPPVVCSAALLAAGPLSLLLLRLLESETTAAPYVSREESIERHRLTKPIDALNTLYSIVFGLSICILSIEPPSMALYASIALAIACGSALMLPFLEKNADKMMHGKVQRFIFPFLVAGLLPVPFADGSARVACMLVILATYLCLTLVCLDSLLCLVKRYRVSPFYLVGRGHAPTVVGVAIGYSIGYFAAYANVLDNDLFPFVSLGLVVLLTAFVTIINFDKDELEEEREGKASESSDRSPAAEPIKAAWRERVAALARENELSAREIEVFELLAKGRGTSYIQEKLYISPHTVKTHTYHIYKKLGVGTREELLTLVEQKRLNRKEGQDRG